jgi:exopolysaccharide production protein ExoY
LFYILFTQIEPWSFNGSLIVVKAMSHNNLSERPTELRLRSQSIPNVLDFWPVVTFLERVGALLASAILLPVLAPSALIVAVLSRQTPFIAHSRVGQYGRRLWVVKLRTMWSPPSGPKMRREFIERISAGVSQPLSIKTSRDPRISSPFAAFLRRYSIDELPQLWQVLRGELALVGPRPITSLEVAEHYGADSAALLSRKPGITGLWQVCGRSRLGYRQRRRLDLFMINHWSLPLYLLILVRTLHRAPLGKDAW